MEGAGCPNKSQNGDGFALASGDANGDGLASTDVNITKVIRIIEDEMRKNCWWYIFEDFWLRDFFYLTLLFYTFLVVSVKLYYCSFFNLFVSV